MRPVVDVGDAWRWAWAQLKSRPLLLAPMPLWIAVGFAVGLTGINVIQEMPDVDNGWGVVFVPVMFLLFGFGHAEVGDGAAQLGVDDPAERPADLVLGGGGGHGAILGGPRGGVFVAHGTLRPTSPCARARASASAS